MVHSVALEFKDKIMKTPCKNCENSGCGSYHDRCEKYQEFKVERQKFLDEKEKYNANEHVRALGHKRKHTKKATNGIRLR